MRAILLVCGGGLFVSCGGAPPPAQVVATTPTRSIVVLDKAPADALVLTVQASRSGCQIVEPGGGVLATLSVPAGRPIKLVVEALEMGSFPGAVVALEGTATRVQLPPIEPGIAKSPPPVEIGFRVDAPGTYHWRCPTLPSGLTRSIGEPYDLEAHNPIKPFAVVPTAEFEAIVARQRALLEPTTLEGRVALGRVVYERKGCVACHRIDGSAGVGPSFVGLWGTTVALSDGSTRVVDAAYVEDSLLSPAAFGRPGYARPMPRFDLRPHERRALIAFIASLAVSTSPP